MQAIGKNLGESLRRSLSAARWSAILVAILAAVWLPVAMAGGPDQSPELFRVFGLTRETVLSGSWWQPLTYGFLHGSSAHLLINVVVLLLIGGRIEHILGGLAAMRIFAFGVLAGAAVHMLLVPGGVETAILVGSSGGAMAWLLTLTTLSPESRMCPIPLSARNLGLGLILGSALLAALHPGLGIPVLSSIGGWVEVRIGPITSIGHACHLGGGIAGWLAGRWVLRPRVTLARLQRQRAAREGRSLETSG